MGRYNFTQQLEKLERKKNQNGNGNLMDNMSRNMGEGATNDEAHGFKKLDRECKRILKLKL